MAGTNETGRVTVQRATATLLGAALVMATLVVLPAAPAAAAPGDFTTFADPAGSSSTNSPYDITAGPDGNLWYTSVDSNRIGRITPDGTITTFADPGGTASTNGPFEITAGPDGNLWYTSFSTDRIGRIDPDAGDDAAIAASFTTFADPAGTSSTDGPAGITAGPDGNLWYTNYSNHRIGRIDPDAGDDAAIAASITTFADPAGTSSTNTPFSITAGPDGNLWYTSRDNDRIGRITPDGTITTFADPDGQAGTHGPVGITAGPDGNVWYTSSDNDRIGRITPDGTITTFADPDGTSSTNTPFSITAGPDGKLWYTSRNSDRIGRITPDGTITTFADPDGPSSTDGPVGITAGPDGNLWYTSYDSDRIGRLEDPAPANDDFADAEALVGGSGTVEGTTLAATAESGEPLHRPTSQQQSVWYSHVPTSDGVLTVDTCAGTSFDTVMAAYTGEAVDDLTRIVDGDDGDPLTCPVETSLTFAVLAGIPYHVAVDGNIGESGTFTLTWSSAPPSFSDVDASNPFFADIEWMAAQGISTGYPDGTYRPSAAVSRQAMSAFMHRLAGEPPFDPPPNQTFTDVSTNHPFREEVEWMAETGISTGYPDGTYRPGIPVSRQAMSAFMHRLADGPGVPT